MLQVAVDRLDRLISYVTLHQQIPILYSPPVFN